MRIVLGIAGLIILIVLGWWFTAESCRLSLWGHSGGALAVGADSNGRFASAGVDHQVIVWTANGQRDTIITGHIGKIEAIALGPNGLIASGSTDGVLKVGERTVTAHKGGVFALVFAASLLYSGGSDKMIRAYDPSPLKEQFILRGHTGRIRALAVSPDNKWLASGGSGDDRARLWPLGKPSAARVLQGTNRRIDSLAFMEGGKVLVVGDRDGKISVWDVESGRERTSWNAHSGPINALTLLGDWVVSGSEDGWLHAWTSTGEKRWTRRNRPVTNALATGSGRTIISADNDGRVRLWDIP
ncbi:MAG: WD40 repeat domain-containing protein [Planctomycetia bacterium]|nr:WD40 repeat domain-containing protein [Planctomycetia bacterium]